MGIKIVSGVTFLGRIIRCSEVYKILQNLFFDRDDSDEEYSDEDEDESKTSEKASIGEDVEEVKAKGKLNRNTVDMVIKKSMNV